MKCSRKARSKLMNSLVPWYLSFLLISSCTMWYTLPNFSSSPGSSFDLSHKYIFLNWLSDIDVTPCQYELCLLHQVFLPALSVFLLITVPWNISRYYWKPEWNPFVGCRFSGLIHLSVLSSICQNPTLPGLSLFGPHMLIAYFEN